MSTGLCSVCLFVAVVLAGVVLSPRHNGVSCITKQEKLVYRNKVVEMFNHAYDSYMTYAYPADELMPLTCKGRVRGRDKTRGDIDHALGRFSLTLIDTLDTLAVIGAVDEFNAAVRAVLRDVTFDNDVVVSVFETNIRVLGGLLGGHFAAESLKEQGHAQLSWYDGQLLAMAEEVGQRLLPAFNTTTGLPYPKINLKYGMDFAVTDTTTCTACAGTMLLEFAALSRATGKPEYEARAHRAMEVLWKKRHLSHNLVGTTINVHSGEWTRKDSGVGAGIDSYYEYCLKSYILLGDKEYLQRFDKHYTAIMRYISNGPLLVDVSMNSPTRMTRTFMDSLLAFWPGLQVLWGDVSSAIHTHEMLYHVTERHRFLPEAFTHDFRVHWASHPLRPEFIESTYFLYKATCDPYYLEVGKTVIDNLERFARVPCGFAGIKDLNTHTHEDRMDSFVLAETFKYLYLLFAEEEELLLDMDGFVFNTEAHLLPLSLAGGPGPPHWREFLANSSHNSSSPGSSSGGGEPGSWEEGEGGVPAMESVVISAPLYCPREDRPYVLRNHYQRLMLKQCTASRFLQTQPNKATSHKSKRHSPPRLSIDTLDFGNRQHLAILSELGIVVEVVKGGKVQVSHVMQKAKTPEDAEEGWYLMQDIMRLMNQQQQQSNAGSPPRSAKLVRILSPDCDGDEILVGPAQFGPNLGKNEFQVSADLVQASPQDGCILFPGDEPFKGKIVLMTRGGCLFVQKVRNAEKAGAAGAIIADNTTPASKNPLPFSMSGDGTDDVSIPSVFMQKEDAARLAELHSKHPVTVLLTWVPEDLEYGNELGKNGVSESDSGDSQEQAGMESESGRLESEQARTGGRDGG